jgi:hypothetical protein
VREFTWRRWRRIVAVSSRASFGFAVVHRLHLHQPVERFHAARGAKDASTRVKERCAHLMEPTHVLAVCILIPILKPILLILGAAESEHTEVTMLLDAASTTLRGIDPITCASARAGGTNVPRDSYAPSKQGPG